MDEHQLSCVEESLRKSPVLEDVIFSFPCDGESSHSKLFQDIATAPGPHREQARQMYSDLRKNLVQNVFKEWKRTGFAWEQYNPDTGRGQRIQHFTGWTSLVVKMMAMPDLPAGKGAGHDEL